MSNGPVRVVSLITTTSQLVKKVTFAPDIKNVIARARSGAFGSSYNPGNTATLTKAMTHRADRYRGYVRELSDRRSDLWPKQEAQFDTSKPDALRDKQLLKKINKLLKANNTYQTPKK